MLMVKEVTILPLERPIAHLAKLRAKKAVVPPKTKPNLAACMKRGETMIITGIIITLLAATLYGVCATDFRQVTPRPPRYFDDFDHWMSLGRKPK